MCSQSVSSPIANCLRRVCASQRKRRGSKAAAASIATSAYDKNSSNHVHLPALNPKLLSTALPCALASMCSLSLSLYLSLSFASLSLPLSGTPQTFGSQAKRHVHVWLNGEYSQPTRTTTSYRFFRGGWKEKGEEDRRRKHTNPPTSGEFVAVLLWVSRPVVVDEVVAIQIGTARKSQCRLGLVVPLEQQG